MGHVSKPILWSICKENGFSDRTSSPKVLLPLTELFSTDLQLPQLALLV